MAETTTQLAIGSTVVRLSRSRPLGNLSAGLCVPANMRGVMAAGLAGEIRVRAGREVERELLEHRPLSLGRAYRTGAGNLATAGVLAIAHAVTSREPGSRPQPAQSERGLREALELLDAAGVRSITLPIVEVAPADQNPASQGRAFGQLIAGHLRRRSRLREVTVAGLDAEFLSSLGELLRETGAIPVDE